MRGVYAPLSKIASEKEIRAVAPIGHRSYPDFGDENFMQILFLLRDLTLPE
jgi:hypothetical protein